MKKLLFLTIVLFTFACNADDSPTPSDSELTTENIFLLRKIYIDNELFTERTYDPDSTLIRIDSYNADTIRLYTEYGYFGDTIRSSFYKSNGDLTNYRNTYELPDNSVRVDRFDNDGSLKNYAIYSFESIDCGYTKLEFFDEDDTSFSISELAYTDANCSNTASNYNADSQIESMRQTIRDDEEVYIHFSLVDLFRVNKIGSITASNFWNQDGVLEEQSSYTAVNLYNDDGYVTMITRTFLDGNIQVYTYEY